MLSKNALYALNLKNAIFDKRQAFIWFPNYLALSGAGQTGNYDRPPLIVSYKIKAK